MQNPSTILEYAVCFGYTVARADATCSKGTFKPVWIRHRHWYLPLEWTAGVNAYVGIGDEDYQAYQGQVGQPT